MAAGQASPNQPQALLDVRMVCRWQSAGPQLNCKPESEASLRFKIQGSEFVGGACIRWFMGFLVEC